MTLQLFIVYGIGRLYLMKGYLAILHLGYDVDVVSDGKLAMQISYIFIVWYGIKRLYLKKSYLAILHLGYDVDVVSDGKLAMKLNYPV